MNVRPEAQKRARDYIDEAIRLQERHGQPVRIDPKVYQSVVQRTAELFERTMRLSDTGDDTSEKSKGIAA